MERQQRRHAPPRGLRLLLLVVGLALLLLVVTTSAAEQADGAEGDTWAVLACTSRFWFNYRHVANALSVYRLVRRLGVPDSRVLLLLAEDVPCNPRNARAGAVFKATAHGANLCGGAEVDYRGNEVTVDNFVRLLTGRHPPGLPASKRLGSGNSSRVLVYMTGHGGDEFLKFHNHEEVSSDDLSATLEEMRAMGRFREMLFIVDTCQGGTLFNKFVTPDVVAVGSSARGENSYAHQNDLSLGVALVDRFTDGVCDAAHALADRVGGPHLHHNDHNHNHAHDHGSAAMQHGVHLAQIRKYLETVPLAQVLRTPSKAFLKSTPVVRTDLWRREAAEATAANFFSDAGRARLLEVDMGLVDGEGVEEELIGGGDAARPPPRWRALDHRCRRGELVVNDLEGPERTDDNQEVVASSLGALAVLALAALVVLGLDEDGEEEEKETGKKSKSKH